MIESKDNVFFAIAIVDISYAAMESAETGQDEY